MKNLNIERHNAKYHIGAIIQGAKILDILKYSKNGKSTLFLWECKCGNAFEAGSSYKIKKICPICANEEANKRHVGVYVIKYEKFIYVGESLNIEKRWKLHNNDLKNNSHHNRQLQELYNSGASLQFEIVYATEYIQRHKLSFKLFNLEQEKRYIDLYRENGYNVLNVEDSMVRMQRNPKLNQLYDKFKSLNISTYNDILQLPNEKPDEWKEFKNIYYALHLNYTKYNARNSAT